jgi:hypothetical protein
MLPDPPGFMLASSMQASRSPSACDQCEGLILDDFFLPPNMHTQDDFFLPTSMRTAGTVGLTVPVSTGRRTQPARGCGGAGHLPSPWILRQCAASRVVRCSTTQQDARPGRALNYVQQLKKDCGVLRNNTFMIDVLQALLSAGALPQDR